MKKTLAVTAAGLLVYLTAAAVVGHLALPTGTKRWVLIGVLWLLGIIAAAAVFWFLNKREKEKETTDQQKADPTGPNQGELDAIIKQAEAKLAKARVGKIGTLPGIFLVGEVGSTKTSTVVHSGLDPEVLAGEAGQGSAIAPTPLANIWLAGKIVIAEAGGALLNDPAGWTRMIRRFQPAKGVVGAGGQAPRAALVCFDIEPHIAGGSVDAARAAARNLRTRLGEISEKLGINLPVYALFTRLDRVPFFLDFIRNLSNEDVRQVLGASLPLSTSTRGPEYNTQESNRLSRAFDELTRSLCDARPELLSREHDEPALPAVYEFPREFSKLRPVVTAFLLELCRPSQLTVGPFLRGFYFSGIRPIIVNEAAPVQRQPEPQEAAQIDIGATRMMKVGAMRGQAAAQASAQQVAGSRKVPQWVFLSHLFQKVLLQDRLAMGASGASTKTSTLRRILLLTATMLCLVFLLGWTISFFQNRGLIAEVRDAETASGVVQPAGLALPSLESMNGLERLRHVLEVLSNHQRYGAPFFSRWGLYSGDELYPKVYSLYFARFKQVMFGETQNTLLDTLRRLPPTPGPDYPPTYDTLKAYLITTSNHDKSTRALAPVLLNRWSSGRNVDAPRMDLARKQFEFYSDELRYANPYSNDNDAAAIGKARVYLQQFGALERIYRAMLADAAKAGPPINFNRRFPDTAEIVLGPYDVAPAFSKPGFGFMKAALQNPEKYFAGEKWVLGDQSASNVDRTNLAVQLTNMYYADYVKEWSAYLKAASVPRFPSIQDAAKKLGSISSNTSPLLALFWLASQNIPADVPEIATPLSPILTVVPASSVDRYIAPPNQGYMTAMLTLQASVETAAAQPHIDPVTAQPVQASATAAKLTVRNVAQAFPPDPKQHLDTQAQKLLEDPIVYVEALVRNPEVPAMNAAAAGTCQVMNPLWAKYPFNPAGKADASIADVNGLFKKPDGAIWKLEAAVSKVLVKQGSQYVAAPGGVTVNPQFVSFFNQAMALADAMYAGNSPDPHFRYALKPLPTTGIPNAALRLELDGQPLNYAGGAAQPQVFNWQAADPHAAKATLVLGGSPLDWLNQPGTWAVFHFFDKADRARTEGGAQLYEWDMRAGRDVFTSNGQPVTVRIEADMGGAPMFFQKGYFGRIRCVPEVAK